MQLNGDISTSKNVTKFTIANFTTGKDLDGCLKSYKVSEQFKTRSKVSV